MSWVSENKFLTGLGVVMVVGVGTLGYLTYAAMDKYEAAEGTFGTATSELQRLQRTTPGLSDANLKALVEQKQELTEKISAFQQELKSRVIPTEPISKGAFQDKLKETVARISSKAATANVTRPNDFYLGFGDYQSRPPDDKVASALGRDLRAIEAVMDVFIQTGNIEIEEFHRDPLSDENAPAGSKRRTGAGGPEGGPIERHGVQIKFSAGDKALRDVLTGLSNHKEQLFVIRNVAIQNTVTESPPRMASAPASPPAQQDPSSVDPNVPAPAEAAAPAPAPTSSLAYVFGTEKITTTINLEILNIAPPREGSDKDKSGKRRDK